MNLRKKRSILLVVIYLNNNTIEIYRTFILPSMKTLDINTTLIDGYVELLDNLSPSNKLDLISKLTLSIKSDITDKKNTFRQSFGAWDSDQTADEIIRDIRESRVWKSRQNCVSM